jgi:hypothetical protein
MRQREQGLLAGIEAAPVRAVLVAVAADQTGEVVEGVRLDSAIEEG